MKQIIKTTPPDEFSEYLKTPGVSYNNLSGTIKTSLRKRLLEDQGYICCYCGQRIDNNEHTKIEHIKCQEKYVELSLCFENMLVSCDGGEQDREHRIKPPHKLHCDAKKANEEIPVSPLNKDIEKYLCYFEDGTVKGKGDTGKELIRVLGLDAKFLNTQRKNAIDQYELSFPNDLEEELLRLRRKNNGRYDEFCFVLEQYITDLINEKNEVEILPTFDIPSKPLVASY